MQAEPGTTRFVASSRITVSWQGPDLADLKLQGRSLEKSCRGICPGYSVSTMDCGGTGPVVPFEAQECGDSLDSVSTGFRFNIESSADPVRIIHAPQSVSDPCFGSIPDASCSLL